MTTFEIIIVVLGYIFVGQALVRDRGELSGPEAALLFFMWPVALPISALAYLLIPILKRIRNTE